MGFLYPLLQATDSLSYGRNSAWYQTGNIEVEVVLRIDNGTAQGSIISLSDFDPNGTENPNCNILWALELNLNQRPYYRHEYGTNAVDWTSGSASAPQLPIGVWKRLKITRVGSTITILIDGVVVHTINFPSSPYPGTAPQQSLWVGRTYTGPSGTYDYGRGFTIAYAQYKGPNGNVLFTFGTDPGGAPGALAPLIEVVEAPEALVGSFTRPAQFKRAADERIEPIGGTGTRIVQRANGYTLEMLEGSTGGGGTDPIQTPRSYPLEASWKRANAKSFSK